MTGKDAFVEKHLDELVGLLVAAFSVQEGVKFAEGQDAEQKAAATKGRFMIGQMRRARTLLGRLWDEMQAEKAKEAQQPKR